MYWPDWMKFGRAPAVKLQKPTLGKNNLIRWNMPKLYYYVAMTLDGYSASEDGSLHWLENFILGPDATPYSVFYDKIGCIMMGANTYEWIIGFHDKWPYQARPCLVMTHRDLTAPDGLDIRFINQPIESVLDEARHMADGKDVWLLGGGKTAAQFADADLIDEMIITIIPVFIGNGVQVLPVTRPLRVKPTIIRQLRSGASETFMDVI